MLAKSRVLWRESPYILAKQIKLIASEGREIRYLAGDSLTSEPSRSLNLIVCNPPFHQNQAVGDQIAWRMFTQARRVLDTGGELLIVGNRHLGYHVKLKRLFGNCRVVDSDKKFVVLGAVKKE